MREYVEGLIAKYHDRGLLIDTNLLLLFVVGLFDSGLITQFKRTKQFVPEDFALLAALSARFSRLWITPNIATEVSNLLAGLNPAWKRDAFVIYAELLSKLGEEYAPSSILQALPAFANFGLTDTSVLRVAAEKYLVLTDDFPLSQYLVRNRVHTLNFNHVRTWGWQ